MAPKKQKAQKMALTDFFADTTTGSWADDDIVPSAPAAKDPSIPKRGDPGYLDAMPDRSARGFSGGPPPREDVPLPTAPPYTAFVGNLTFETDESELLGFFQDLTPVTSRLVKSEGKSKGFGYVEFGDVDKLKQALARSGAQLGGRTVRISVAEAPSTSRREFAPSAAEEASQWRRTGPLPARDPPPQARRGGSFQNSSPVDGGAERDWGSARGAKFTPSPQVSSGQFTREPSGPGRMREEMGPSQADEADRWRSSRPLVDVRAAAPGPARGGMMSEQSSPGLADTESTWSRGSKLKTPVNEVATPSGTGSPVERDWTRKPAAEARQDIVEGESPRLPSAPVERRKLNLAPRSVAPASDAAASSAAVTSPTTRSSIFGGAQPIDSAAKEAAAADKLKQQAAERRAAAQKAKDEEERKVKQFAEERERSIKEALAAANGGSAPGAPAERGQGGGGGRARGGPPSGPARRISHDRPPHIRPNSDGGSTGNGASTNGGPSSSSGAGAAASSRQAPQVDADGFAVATGGRQSKSIAPPITSPTNAPGQQPQRKEVKKGFSFSAAVAQKAFAEEESGKGDDEGVEEVRKGVEETSV